ncbi:MAG: sigma-70 family RNA polymerase sigma factor [Pedobacter sp.]|uniref:RNA polymerase sigma factor n=1 Tax=Pedobacter sp. TaxID=1411316 RepID=UPI002808B809|nr:sigma-70 family RNA polymerase sigma factor [Pedobacter sp.]MDQ8005723.1 sigma-70 family RNA polymerase sigma factor [Pedobacter sp.]
MSEIEFLELLSQNQGIIGKICSVYCNQREDYEDLFQEITYHAWKGYPSFRGEAKFSTWLYRIALNTAISSFRKRKPAIDLVSVLPDHITEQSIEAKEQKQQLLWAIKQLNEGERAIIAMYLDEMNYQEIAEIIGITENNVGVKVNRIKTKLHKILSHGNR